MRTAEEIIRSYGKLSKSGGEEILPISFVAKLINEARNEAIDNCAKQLIEPIYDFSGKRYNDQLQKIILDLRKELK